ncbi:hypothetical protein ABWH96_16655 [Marivirga tractuosa]|uniref:hypothetical protein n=1 Tax=Marivirga tractuosa TaxID=1006 RepID=UPI0035CF1EA5
MRNLVLSLITCFLAIINHVQAQEAPPSNQTIIRLTIVNDNNEILMRKTQYGWMTPAVYFTERQNIHEVLDSLTAVYGIKTSVPDLRGLFTYKYEFKSTADMRQLYVANYESGTLKPSTNEEEVYWMPIKDALIKLESTVPSLKQITEQTIDHPNILWGASYILYRKNGNLSSKIEEGFYPLMKNIKKQ